MDPRSLNADCPRKTTDFSRRRYFQSTRQYHLPIVHPVYPIVRRRWYQRRWCKVYDFQACILAKRSLLRKSVPMKMLEKRSPRTLMRNVALTLKIRALYERNERNFQSITTRESSMFDDPDRVPIFVETLSHELAKRTERDHRPGNSPEAHVRRQSKTETRVSKVRRYRRSRYRAYNSPSTETKPPWRINEFTRKSSPLDG